MITILLFGEGEGGAGTATTGLGGTGKSSSQSSGASKFEAKCDMGKISGYSGLLL